MVPAGRLRRTISPEYAELHCHSYFSFKEGASAVEQLVVTASDLGYRALALTDHDNLSGAMQFAQTSRSLGLHGIIGVELTLKDGYHLTALAETAEGYSNLCWLLSCSHVLAEERTEPELDPRLLPEHSRGLIVLSGCRKGEIPRLVDLGRIDEAKDAARRYIEWFGPQNFFLELQQNLAKGDTKRNRRLVDLAGGLGIGVVASNNVHYHTREYHQLQDCLVAIKHCQTLEETHRERRPNSEFFLKSPKEMDSLFKDCPEAMANTISIAEKCVFDLTRDLKYRFPDYPAPGGHTPQSYLEKLCYEAAQRRYGSITPKVKGRLEREFHLIRKHDLAGFLLHYYDIVQLARKVMIKLGLSDPEIPLEERPPGRGRGSSVALLVGYLIGLSHIDPLQYDLSLERFLPDDLMAIALDIDLDFPRNIREELILAVHEKWGWDRAALTGMRSTYQIKGAIRDLGKALGLPEEQVDKLAKRVDHASARHLESEMKSLPEFRPLMDRPGWKELVGLAKQLDGAPRYVGQHPGGMIISSVPLTDMVPVQRGAIEGRYVCQWDKDDIDAAAMVKIDFLALGALSQLQEALQLIERRAGHSVDISRIDFGDPEVYDMLCAGATIGVFQVESAAQMQTITRIRPRNLTDMAYEVACVRPGVGVHDGVRHFIRRRSGTEPVTYDHPLERRALERTLGIVLYQDQMNQLAIDVGGLSPYEADQTRRAFTKRNATELIKAYWRKFRTGALEKGVEGETAVKIFRKFNGHYMFPEAHAVAFGVTAYQLAWVKYYHPVEFMTALFNQQPMGFWGLETLKEDAKHHQIQIFNPDINRSSDKCTIEGDAIRLGFLNVANVGEAVSKVITGERTANGPYKSLGDFMRRSGLERQVVESLIYAGAFDDLADDRRTLLWEAGLRYRPASRQLALDLPVEQDMAALGLFNDWERMASEYSTLGLCPNGHLMEKLRSHLGKDVVTSDQLKGMKDGQQVKVAGLVARPLQHPLANAYFISLQDEYGFIPLIIWPTVYEKWKARLREPLLLVEGVVTRREGTLNVVVTKVAVPRLDNRNHGLQVSPSEFLKLPRPIFR
jgi:error-prone DNA polymerase